MNSWYQMVKDEFPEQYAKMQKWGRRNISFSTVAPTGTVSLMTQTTSGLEPLFKAYYIRRKKINPSEEGSRVDYTDQSGDTWQEYAVLHPKFKEWIKTYLIKNMEIVQQEGPLKGYKFEKRDIDNQLLDKMIEYYSKEQIQELFKVSPWYGSEADDISWEKRVEIQAVIQRYTTNAISSTINLPKDIPQEVVKNIYLKAYHSRLKGITVYRDGSRSGVLITETVNKTTTDKFGYNNSIKRPVELEADYYFAISKGRKYAVIVGLLDGLPFEVFAYENPGFEEDTKGKIVKIKRGVYSFISNRLTIQNLQLTSDHEDEKLLTRWVSLLLRHGANPKYIADQVQKSEVHVVSFGKVITRVLKNYIPDEILGEKCDNCNEVGGMIYEEGCKKCKLCGHSKC